MCAAPLQSMDRFPGCTMTHALGGMKFEIQVAISILSLNKVYAGCATSLKDNHICLGKVDCELTLLTKA